MRIGIDIDGVLSQTYEKWIELWRAKGHDVKLVDYAENEGFGRIGISDESVWSWYEQNKDIRETYSAYPGVRVVLSLLGKHDLVAITSRDLEIDTPHPSTQVWLNKNDIHLTELHFIHRKSESMKRLKIDLMIEDSPSQARKIAEVGIPVLLFDKHYNQSVDHELITRFSHWGEIPELIRRAS